MASLLNDARKYVVDACQSGVMTLLPEAVANRVKCDPQTAIKLLLQLRTEQLVELRAFLTCPFCGEHTEIRSRSPKTVESEARALAGKQCWNCGVRLPRPRDLEVRFTFFCSPATAAGGSETGPPAKAHESTSSDVAVKLSDLRSINAGGNVNINFGNGNATQLSDTLHEGGGNPTKWWIPLAVALISLVGTITVALVQRGCQQAAFEKAVQNGAGPPESPN
jgi:hypothetical protein